MIAEQELLMIIKRKSRNFIASLWKFVSVIILTIIFMTGCGQRSSVLQVTEIASSTPDTITTNTPKATLRIEPIATVPLPTETNIPTVSPTLIASPTIPPEAINLTLWVEWQLNYDGRAAWSPDSNYIAFTDYNMAGLDDHTYLYNVNTLQQVWQVDQGAGDMIFSPDGKTIVDFSRFIDLWDVDSGQVTGPYMEGNARYYVDFLPDGTLVVGKTWIHGGRGDEYGVSVIGLAALSDNEIHPLEDILEYEGALDDFDVSPDGKLLVTAMTLMPDLISGHRVFIWDLENRTIRCDFPDYSGAAFSPADSALATLELNSGKIIMFDTSDCQPFQILHEANFVATFSFSPDGKLLAYAGSPDGVIWIQSVQTGELLYRERGFPDLIKQLFFSPDGKFLLVLGSINVESKDTVRDVVQIWQIQSGMMH